MPSWRRADFYGFPPGRDYVLLPRRPGGAARTGLVLYDPSLLHQKVAARAGRLLLRAGLGGLLPLRRLPRLPDPAWWSSFIADVAEPVAGPVAAAAFRPGHLTSGNPVRATALLIGAAAEPLAFVKLALGGDGDGSLLAADVLRLVAAGGPGRFRVPELLAAGEYRGAEYLLQAPMPARHVGAGWRPGLVAAVVDDVQVRLGGLDRPPGTPPHHVPVHGSLSPANLRLDGDGTPWLIDWDRTGWGPSLADELRYWIAYHGHRPGPVGRRADRALADTSRRGRLGEVGEALAWRIATRPREPDGRQQRLRDALAARLRRGAR